MAITVNFTDQSTPGPSGPITAWAWDFGDGGTSTSQNPSHNYATAGLYAVSLTITGTGSDGTDEVLLSVIVLDTAALNASFTHSDSGLAVTFTDTSTPGPSGPITGWAWNFGDTNTSSSQNPSHTYAAAGTYTATLTVTGTSPDGTDVATTSLTVSATTGGSVYWGAYLDKSVPIHYYGSTTASGASWGSGPNTAAQTDNTWSLWEAHCGKTISVINFGWGFRYGGFPTSLMNTIWNRGCIPAINMNWGVSNTSSSPGFTNAQIVAGNNDTNWTNFFTAAASYNKPFFLLPCVEFNGSWTYEGGLQSDGTFNPTSGNTTTNFKSAWQHIWNLANSAGANTCCTWAWIPNAINPGYNGIYDNIEDYYPGSGYVDWTGMDTFSYSYPLGTFTQNCQPTYDRITGHVSNSKPMMISQIAAAAADSPRDPVNNTNWINSMFTGLPNFPLIKAFMWFSWHLSNGKHNNEIEDPYSGSLPITVGSWASRSGMAAATAFATGIANTRYKPKFSSVLTAQKVPTP